MREFVPGHGPAISGEGNTRLEGQRLTEHAAAVAPAAAATAAIFAAGELVSVRTRVANEQIRATLIVDRDNAAAGGNGTYGFLVDAVASGPTRAGPTGTNAQGTVVLDTLLTIAVAGAHTIGAQVTSNVDVETVTNSFMIVQANEFVAA